MVIFFLLLTVSLYGAEADHFSQYDAPLKDSLNSLNRLTNDHLGQVLKKTRGCGEDRLYKGLREHFNNSFQGILIDQVIGDNSLGLDKIKIPLKESVYQDFSFLDAPILSLFKGPAMAELIRLYGVVLGTDKLEHFWGAGYSYFDLYYLKKRPLGEALKYGWEQESGLFGSITTGVISYGDLSANFNGMRFWNHILQKQEDIFGQNLGPYVECQKGQWAQVKQVEFANYVDQSFDESINCSIFRNERILKKIQKRMRILSEVGDVELTCPMNSEALDSLKDKYGVFAPYLLNFYGHQSRKNPEFSVLYPYPLKWSASLEVETVTD